MVSQPAFRHGQHHSMRAKKGGGEGGCANKTPSCDIFVIGRTTHSRRFIEETLGENHEQHKHTLPEQVSDTKQKPRKVFAVTSAIARQCLVQAPELPGAVEHFGYFKSTDKGVIVQIDPTTVPALVGMPA